MLTADFYQGAMSLTSESWFVRGSLCSWDSQICLWASSLSQSLPRQDLHQCQFFTVKGAQLGSLSSNPPCPRLGHMFLFVVREHLSVSRWWREKWQCRLCVLVWNGWGSGTGGQRGESRGVTHSALAPRDRICEYPCATDTCCKNICLVKI